MRFQVFVDRRRLFVTDVDPGGVSACVQYIKEMVDDGGLRGPLVIALDSDTFDNVTYLIRKESHR